MKKEISYKKHLLLMLCMLLSTYIAAMMFVNNSILPELDKVEKELAKAKHHNTTSKDLLSKTKSNETELNTVRDHVENLQLKIDVISEETKSEESSRVGINDSVGASKLREDVIRLSHITGLRIADFKSTTSRSYTLSGYSDFNSILQFCASLNLLDYAAIISIFDFHRSIRFPGQLEITLTIEL